MKRIINAHGWVCIQLNEQHENAAMKFRIKRDAVYGNIFSERTSDARWVGDLGEWVFNSFLRSCGLTDAVWLRDGKASGEPDFKIGNLAIGVKTVKRKVAPQKDYTAQITARHANEPVTHFFFLTYDIVNKRMWLIGGIDKPRFLNFSQYFSAGDKVHDNYVIRPNHEIYNIGLQFICPPLNFIGVSQ